MRVYPQASGASTVAWRVRGEWLEIDTGNNGTFQTRMRPLGVTKDGGIVIESATGKKSVWRNDHRVRIVVEMVPARPGFYMP